MTISAVDLSRRGAGRPSPRALRRVLAAMDRDGVVALEGLFSARLVRRLRAEVLRRHRSGELRGRGLVRDIGGRYAALLPFEGPFLAPAFYAGPALTAIAAGLLGPEFCIGSLEAVISLPGSSRQHQHIDAPIRFDRLIGGRRKPFAGDLSALPPYAVTLCVPLCDLGEENGPTELWPGSHRAALRPRPPGETAIGREFRPRRMDGPLGRAFLFDFRTFHRGLPNFSREPRPLLMFVLVRRWFRDPNLAEVFPRVVIAKRNLDKVPARHRGLFLLAPAARRRLWAGTRTG